MLNIFIVLFLIIVLSILIKNSKSPRLSLFVGTVGAVFAAVTLTPVYTLISPPPIVVPSPGPPPTPTPSPPRSPSPTPSPSYIVSTVPVAVTVDFGTAMDPQCNSMFSMECIPRRFTLDYALLSGPDFGSLYSIAGGVGGTKAVFTYDETTRILTCYANEYESGKVYYDDSVRSAFFTTNPLQWINTPNERWSIIRDETADGEFYKIIPDSKPTVALVGGELVPVSSFASSTRITFLI